MGSVKKEASWNEAKAPAAADVYSSAVAAISGTFQQTDTAMLGRLHCFVSSEDVRLSGGTGAAVAAAGGFIWPALMPYYFFPLDKWESLGWATLDGATKPNLTVAPFDIA